LLECKPPLPILLGLLSGYQFGLEINRPASLGRTTAGSGFGLNLEFGAAGLRLGWDEVGGHLRISRLQPS